LIAADFLKTRCGQSDSLTGTVRSMDGEMAGGGWLIRLA
jgi:hypothetical protein